MHHVFFAFLVISASVHAQSVSTRMGARAGSLGNAGFALRDESSFFQNAGALGFADYPSAFFAHELVPELIGANRSAVAVSLPLFSGIFSAGAFRFGDDVYSEQLVAAGFAHRLGETSLGVKVNMLQYRADGFGTRTAFTVDVGGLTQLTPEWSVGAGIFNVNQSSLNDDEKLPVVFVAALSWHTPDGPLLILETEKHLQAPLAIRGGMEIGIRKKLLARSGFSVQPVTLTAGIGWITTRLKLDFATQYHQVFGFIYQASAGYSLTRKRPT